MKSISLIALIAALSFASVAVGASVATNADATTTAQVNATTSSVGVDVSASASASGEVSASAPDTSSMLDQSSMSSMTSSEMSQACADLGGAGMTTTSIDAAALAAVENVTVFSISDCSGLGDMAAMDTASNASLAANAKVAAALQTSGYAGQQVVGYALDGTSLTVYVKKS